ncbi:MAG TPA: hypothetical protein VFG69_14300 [Nannocystaceae bacterium]|nr:hypothetical protein [Nannocystaceae bacterium]
MPWQWLLAALLLGCEAVAPASARQPETAPSTPTPTAAPSPPLAGMTPPAAGEEVFDGVVEERLAAGSYTYLAVRTGGAAKWVATMGDGAALGASVRIESMGTRTDFHSRRLDRTFPELVFGVVVDGAAR